MRLSSIGSFLWLFLHGSRIHLTFFIFRYDYDAPLSEAGDITSKYVAIAKAVRQFRGLPPVSFPPNTTKHAYGKVLEVVIRRNEVLKVRGVSQTLSSFSPILINIQIQMECLGTLALLLPFLIDGRPTASKYPLTMEHLRHYEGLILYRTQVPKDLGQNVTLAATGE